MCSSLVMTSLRLVAEVTSLGVEGFADLDLDEEGRRAGLDDAPTDEDRRGTGRTKLAESGQGSTSSLSSLSRWRVRPRVEAEGLRRTPGASTTAWGDRVASRRVRAAAGVATGANASPREATRRTIDDATVEAARVTRRFVFFSGEVTPFSGVVAVFSLFEPKSRRARCGDGAVAGSAAETEAACCGGSEGVGAGGFVAPGCAPAGGSGMALMACSARRGGEGGI